MLRQFHSELGEKAREGAIIATYGALTGKFKLYSNVELKGQGIKVDDATGKGNYLNKPSYWVTKKAFERICKKYEVDQELLFN
jgi:hypothetical protein